MVIKFTGRVFAAVLLAALAWASSQPEEKSDTPAARQAVVASAVNSARIGSGRSFHTPTPPGTKVAQIASMEGSILVSVESGLVAGWKGMPLGQGVRVIAMLMSDAIVKYDDGCEVRGTPEGERRRRLERPLTVGLTIFGAPQIRPGAGGDQRRLRPPAPKSPSSPMTIR